MKGFDVALGWPSGTVGELDHRRLKTPSVKLRSATVGAAGDVVYCIDFRVRSPNANCYLSSTELHSLEHFLLEGAQRLLPDNFLSIGVMGCQTGFYLTLLNEGRAGRVCEVIAAILEGILEARCVPYACIEQCGNFENHSVELAQQVAKEVLAERGRWLEVL
ncbi:Autoinducer-2 production protein [gamma proteobacterium HdN1]|nr:Autoinducer-2 production protein [gamma proteobacterium HdN1]